MISLAISLEILRIMVGAFLVYVETIELREKINKRK